MEKEEFKKKYPNLAEEIELGKGKADLQFEVEAPKNNRKFAGYNPTIIDFIRRCNSEDQAIEIIEYMMSRDEITKEYSKELKTKLEVEGLSSFGEMKKPGYYEREG